MSEKLDMDRIAEGLGARRKGKVKSGGGYFGALQLGAEVAARSRVVDSLRDDDLARLATATAGRK